MFVRDFNSKLEYFRRAKKLHISGHMLKVPKDKGDDLCSDHLPIEVSIDAPPHRNSSINHTRYKFDQTNTEVFEATVEVALGSTKFSGLMSTGDLDKYADFIVTAISTTVDKTILKSKSECSESITSFLMKQ